MKIQFTTLLMMLAFTLSSKISFAQFGMDPGAFSAYMYSYETRDDLEEYHEEIFGQTIEESLGNKVPGKASTVVPSTSAPTGVIEELAQAYPPEHRAQAKQVFREILAGYKKLEAHYGLPRNDLSSAVAAFIAGSYIAYNQVDVPDQNFKALASQMKVILSRSPDIAKASAKEKKEVYERLAILGTFAPATLEALNQNPNHPEAAKIKANLKNAGKNYLEAFLGTSASRVQITSKGLTLK